MPTQSDVAKLAGVSTATVSRVINGRKVVTEDVRLRVAHAIDTLQYIPHAGARALALQRSNILGIIVPSLQNRVFAAGVGAFESAAQSLGYTLLLAVSHDDPDLHTRHVLRMIEQGVDGLLLVGKDHPASTFERLEKASVRHLCAWSHDAGVRPPTIGYDDAQAMHAVVDHLVNLGHRQFGMLVDTIPVSSQAGERVQGVLQRLDHHGYCMPPHCIVEVTSSIEKSRRGFWKLIENDLSAIICANDVIAHGALLEALRMGLVIPEDLSITGFDDLDLSAELQPALTTVQSGAVAIGDQAARALIDAVENKSPLTSLKLNTQLVLRQTTGACTSLLQ